MSLEVWSFGIAVLALVGTAYTAWLTLLRRGAVRMTQPTVVFFGPDGGRADRAPKPKVFLRTLLYSTADRGQVLENMYVVLRRGAESTTFSIWVYGDQSLARGAGCSLVERSSWRIITFFSEMRRLLYFSRASTISRSSQPQSVRSSQNLFGSSRCRSLRILEANWVPDALGSISTGIQNRARSSRTWTHRGSPVLPSGN